MTTQARKRKGADRIPHGAWHVTTALWGQSQRVRLVTGPPSLVSEPVHVRSIHVVAWLDASLLLVQNKDTSWTFPGGRLEGSETLEQALRREVWEEARAILRPGYCPLAATRIEFLNRVPGRVYRVHPTFLTWVMGEVETLSDEPHHDPADGVIGRRVVTPDEARELLGELERVVLEVAVAEQRKQDQKRE